MLSRLARDLLSVPATGAGVERLFNSARDICHYRRGSLNESTIQDLMMYMCSEKFTLDSQQLSSLEKSPIESSSQETLEEKEALEAHDEDFDPISDDEEITHEANEDHDVAVEEADRPDIMVTEASPVNDHEQDVGDEENDDEGPLLPPPFTQLNDRLQKRSSGRTTMPSSRLQGYEVY